MADRPIIFSAPMVRALLAGTKTQTRRLVKPDMAAAFDRAGEKLLRRFPNQNGGPYAPGDRLWVREAFARVGDEEDDVHACPDLRVWSYYKADNVVPEQYRWRPSIHLPRWASRLTLTVTDVRAQRLQDISEEDAIAEGIERINDPRGICWRSYETLSNGKPHPHSIVPNRSAVISYRELWNSLHGPDAWDANPWVWAISFSVAHHNIDTSAPSGAPEIAEGART